MLILCLSYFIITVPSCKRLKQNYSIFFLRSNFQKKKSRHLYFYIQYTYMAWNSYMWKWVGCLNNLKRSRFSSKNSKLQQGLLWIFSSVWSAAALLQLCSGLCHLLLPPSSLVSPHFCHSFSKILRDHTLLITKNSPIENIEVLHSVLENKVL